ncbi:MAG: lysostaphin resistance A-like protein [Cyanobacteriota bacterium]
MTAPAPGLPSPLPPPPGGPSPRSELSGWKGLLAVMALSLCGLLWFSGLRDSLERPSVVGALDIQQLELSALAAEALPPSWGPLLVGDDPRALLRDTLEAHQRESSSPMPVAQRLTLALLEGEATGQATGAKAPSLAKLSPLVNSERRPLLRALQRGAKVPASELTGLLEPWGEKGMVAQLSCERLGGPAASCPAQRLAPWLVARLLGLTLVPALLLLTGTALLCGQLWLLWRRRLPPSPPVVGPPLSLADVILVIAGGFVLVGEVVLPPFTRAALSGLVAPWPLSAASRQGLEVLTTYLSLMVAPLALLALLVPRTLQPPPGGWLQWGWLPPAAVTRPAVKMVLMVLPLVAVAGWLLQLVWNDPGGTNPLLEMVLATSDGWALLAFALTAVVLAPLFEETLFRGVLLPVVARHLGAPWAVLISALVFAIAHLSLAELVPLSVLGVGLGVVRWQTGRLGASVCLHALWNGLTFLNLLLLAS